VGVVGADGKVDIRVVQTAEQVGALSIIDKGLSAGDKVIVSDMAKLRPGITVRAVPASDSSSPSAAPARASSSSPGP
jgi:membrane fusion protein (multidrug efflux system)